MTVRQALAEGNRLLKLPCTSASIDTPNLDAALLLAETLHIDRAGLLIRGNDRLNEEDHLHFKKLLERRRSGECIAYILGRKEFRSLQFTVSPHVLVPRPDTETLLDAAIERIKTHVMPQRQDKTLSILDLCTGSGAVAISLKNEIPQADVWATDISAEALEIAKTNTKRLLTIDAIHFYCGDLFHALPDVLSFDIIVSNPPYIPSGELSSLAPEVQMEPQLALDGGKDGLELIRKIIPQAKERLLSGGFLLLEADPEQMPSIRSLLSDYCFGNINVSKDLAGRERVISAKVP